MAGEPAERELLDRLVRDHLPTLLRLATRLTGDSHTAEEVVQDSLARIACSWRDFQQAASFRTWATRIVINVFRDHLRRTRREPARESCNATDNADATQQIIDHRRCEPQATLLATELAETVAQHVSALPARQREVLILIVYEGMSPTAAAESLDTTTANIHSTLYAARQNLAARLADYLTADAMEPREASRSAKSDEA